MAHYQGPDCLGTDPVDKAPHRTGNQGSHHQHEVEGPDVYESIYYGCYKKGKVMGMLPSQQAGKGALDLSAPEKLFSRADEHQQQDRY